MKKLTVFCSACDRNVAIVPQSDDWTLRVRGLPCLVGEVSCLEHGVRCTGTLCPFHSIGPDRRSNAVADRGAAQPTL